MREQRFAAGRDGQAELTFGIGLARQAAAPAGQEATDSCSLRIKRAPVILSQIPHWLVIEELLDALAQAVAHIAVSIKNALAGSFDDGRI